jgi:hypothetical protein
MTTPTHLQPSLHYLGPPLRQKSIESWASPSRYRGREPVVVVAAAVVLVDVRSIYSNWGHRFGLYKKINMRAEGSLTRSTGQLVSVAASKPPCFGRTKGIFLNNKNGTHIAFSGSLGRSLKRSVTSHGDADGGRWRGKHWRREVREGDKCGCSRLVISNDADGEICRGQHHMVSHGSQRHIQVMSKEQE